MIRKVFNAEGGFTLVESVMAVIILGLALGATILSFSMAMRAVNTAGNQTLTAADNNSGLSDTLGVLVSSS